MQYQGVPASPNSPNIQPPSPGSPMQSPMMNQTKSTQFINKTPNNVSIRPTTPSTFQPASFSYQAQPHGYLPMHSNGSLPQDQKCMFIF
jgi:hypothetical protein